MHENYKAIEIAQISEYPNDVLLCGIEGLAKIDRSLNEELRSGNINQQNLFKNVFRPYIDKFFYTISSSLDGKILGYESGIGYFFEYNSSCFVKRVKPIYSGRNFSHRIKSRKSSSFYDFKGITVISVSSPHYLSDLMIGKNEIITSKRCNTPISINIDQNSFVGRLDGDLCSISLNSDEFINIVLNSLVNHTKQLSLKTSKLSAPKLSTNEIQLNHNEGNNAKKNTLVYDERLDVIKFFDGNKWRKLKWEEDVSQE